MKTKEFNLSEKMHTSTLDIAKAKKEHIGYFKREDIKEFIKRLKEEFILYRTDQFGDKFITPKDKWFLKRIDKLAGDKLK